MASAPARQLNNKGIRSALVSKVLPAVQGTCSLLSAKVSYNKYEGTEVRKVDDLWLNICRKRDECDEAIKQIKGVAFFFSSVSALERRSREKRQENTQDQEDEENETSDEKYWPAITYWIAVQSSNGMRVSTVPLHSALLNTGMEVTAKALPTCKRGNEEESAAPLCTTVKDHNNMFIQNKVDLSFAHGMEILQHQLIDEPVSTLHGSERVVRLQVISSSFTTRLRDKLIPALVSAGLEFDLYGIAASNLPSQVPKVTKALASPLVVAMNDVERAMVKLGYALHGGEVFKKAKSSKYTYQHCCSVKKFLSLLGSGDQFKDTIVKHLNKLVEILGDRECEFTKQLRLNYDLIEVNGGWCFSVSQRKFVLNPIADTDIGKESPRAYISYEPEKIPEPGYFKQILENSLQYLTEIDYFCEYYVRLLNCGIKQHKERVLCLIGEPNSGKTSLFAPITRVIPERYIAKITKQKSFNKSMIDKTTQIMFLDEAYAKLLDPDDWKVLTQGGLTAYDRKYKSSKSLNIRCPMFITCQEDMDFGKEHNAAMDVRLRKFQFKTLKSPPLPGVQKFLKDHAMDCIVWVSRTAKTPGDELPPPVPGPASEEDLLDENEKERIQNLTMEDSESDNASGDDAVQETCGQSEDEHSLDEDDERAEDNPNSSYSDSWEESLARISKLQDQQPRHSLKQRQLELIGAGVKRQKDEFEKQLEADRVRVLEGMKAKWISLGMMRENDAHLLESVEGPYHPNIERSRAEYFAKKKEDKEIMLAEKARTYYGDEWVQAKERELQELQKKEDAAVDQDTKAALSYMISVAVDALRLRFQREEVPGLKRLVLSERRRTAVELGWSSRVQAESITSIWSPLPYPKELALTQSDDEHDIFITPQSTARSAHSESQPFNSSQRKRPRRKNDLQMVPKRGRISHFFPPSRP